MSRKSAYRRRIKNASSNAGMADIALMILVMLMCMSSWQKERWGITMRLPPWTGDELVNVSGEHPPKVVVDINDKNQLMINSDRVELKDLKFTSKTILLSEIAAIEDEGQYDYVVLRIRVNRNATYKAYIYTLNEVVAAKNEILNDAAKLMYQLDYKLLDFGEKREVHMQYPIVIEDVDHHMIWDCC